MILTKKMRICTACEEEKVLSSEFFHRKKRSPSGFNRICKVCLNIQKREYASTPESKYKKSIYAKSDKAKDSREVYASSPRGKEVDKAYRNTPEFKNTLGKKREDYLKSPKYKKSRLLYRSTPEYKIRQTEYNSIYFKKPSVRKRIAETAKIRREADPTIRLQQNLRASLRDNLRGAKTGSVLKYIGCSVDELLAHLNTGKYTFTDYETNTKDSIKFHIDHIIPSKYFKEKLIMSSEGKVSSESEYILYKWWNYRNLRVWPALENISKNARMDMTLILEHDIEGLLV